MPIDDALVVAGAFGIDTNVYEVGERHGAELTFAGIRDGPGQAGSYSALAARALGVPTRAIAALGADGLGDWIREALVGSGVDVTELRDPRGTHRSVNLVAADGSRRNFFDARGASETLIDAEACRRALRGARLLHVHLDDWCRHLLPLAREEGVLVSCDLQDVVDIDDPYRAEFVAAAHVIFASTVSLADPGAAALELSRRRPGRLVLMGAGADGCLVASDGTLEQYPAVELAGRPVVDANGAGDNLAVGFLVARLFDGLPVAEAVRRAQIGARWICAQRGDEKTPLTRERLDELLRQAA